MARIHFSAVMTGAAEPARGLLRSFGTLGKDHPCVAKSLIESGNPADTVGKVRDLRTCCTCGNQTFSSQ